MQIRLYERAGETAGLLAAPGTPHLPAHYRFYAKFLNLFIA